MGSGAKTYDSTKPMERLNPSGDLMGYSRAKANGMNGTPGFSYSGMYDAGKSYQQAMFRDNATGQRMDSRQAASSLIGQQPMMNQSSMIGSGVTAGQTAPIDFMGMDGSGLAQLMNRSPFAAQSAGLLLGGTTQWDKDLAKQRSDMAQKAFAAQRKF